MLNSRSRSNKSGKVLKVLQVKDMKLGYLYKNLKKEQTKVKEVKEELTLAEYVKDKKFLESKEVYDITLSICETMDNLISLNCSMLCTKFNPMNLIITNNKKILLKDIEFLNGLQVIDDYTMFIPNGENTYLRQHIQGQAVREKVIYTIGSLMYFMATGKMPISSLEPLLEDSYGNNVDSNLKRIIQKCLDIDIRKRYVSIEELSKEIIIQLLIKSKYPKKVDVSSSIIDSSKLSGDIRLKRVDKLKSKRKLSSKLSRISAALSTLF